MIRPPDYFERVRASAAKTWEKLSDPDVIGITQSLFQQIQIPRHVVSELLQNADDAGATEARISIQDDTFVFAHDGRDFVEEDFQSLCRFGYSNKRALHTIGFRGIGFKSAFSIGDRVELRSPTLAVFFGKDRFIEPVWDGGPTTKSKWTMIQVRIQKDHLRRKLEKNLHEWMQSPASLLFLRSVRRLTIQGEVVHWKPSRVGPVTHSEWVSISNTPNSEALHIRSSEEAFPDEALIEISQERQSGNEDLHFPPCSVELVLGMKGDIYVILPAAVHTELPFAVNAPFIQDPGRSKLKEPEISCTNRWLLKRVGKLAAESMLEWVQQSDLDQEERCQAYGLVPQAPLDDGSLESRCHQIVFESFWDFLDGCSFLLTESGRLVVSGKAVAVPRGLLKVWDHHKIAEIFLGSGQAVLARSVSTKDAKTLEELKDIEILSAKQIPQILEDTQPPYPGSSARLLELWHLCAENLLSHDDYLRRTEAQILPASGSNQLHSASDVVRASGRMSAQLGDDWLFLAERLLPLSPEWLDFVTSLSKQDWTHDEGNEALKVLDALGLGHAADTHRIVASVTQKLFSEEHVSLEDAVCIAQIAAKLDVSVTDQMHYVTCDSRVHSSVEDIVTDLSGEIDLFADQQWINARVLHSDYQCAFRACSKSEWNCWVQSGKSRLQPFIPIDKPFVEIYGKEKFESDMLKRGVTGTIPENSYIGSQKFGIHDRDFSEKLWGRWEDQAGGDSRFWARLLEHILTQPQWYWESALQATPVFIAKTGRREREVDDVLVPSSWILHLQGLRCLEDNRGLLHEPSELLLRTPDTESNLDVEPFVRADLDTRETRPLLLALGVRHKPTDASGYIRRLRALASAPKPPVHEILKWYAHLDRFCENKSSEQIAELRTIFLSEKLILTSTEGWATANAVFLSEDALVMPNVSVIHELAKNLSLWQRLGVADKPTEDRVLAWLKALPIGAPIPIDQFDAIQGILAQMPSRVWSECDRWLDLNGRWLAIEDFLYVLNETGFSVVDELFLAVRQQTADLRFLPDDCRARPPFADMPSLTSLIELRTGDSHELVGTPRSKAWIVAFANQLQRIRLPHEKQQSLVRQEALRLSETTWWTVRGRLEIVPQLDETPVGTPHEVEAVWHGRELLVADHSAARLASAVIDEVARPFSRPDIRKALGICYERLPGFVHEYLVGVFDFDAEEMDASRGNLAPTQRDTEEDAPSSSVDERNNAFGSLPAPEEASSASRFETWLSPRESEEHSENPQLTKTPTPQRERHELMSHFLRARGYSVDGSSKRFTCATGGWTQKSDMGLWKEYDSSGNLKQCYWAKEHCLERVPLALPAEIWELCRQQPGLYTLVLANAEGLPETYDGHRLQELRQAGRLKLHAAEYRLEMS